MNTEKILFISGWGTGKEVWSNVIKGLDKKNSSEYIPWYKCLKTDIDNDDISKFLNSVSKPVILVGWSLGGMVALRIAAKFPEKVSGLILVSASARMIQDAGYVGVNKRVIKAMKLRLKTDKSGLLNDFAEMGIAPSKDKTIISEFVNNALGIESCELSAGLTFLMDNDFRNLLNRLKMPVHILHGKYDQIMNVENAVYLNQNIENSTLNIINREGHFLPQTKHEIIINSIDEMLLGD